MRKSLVGNRLHWVDLGFEIQVLSGRRQNKKSDSPVGGRHSLNFLSKLCGLKRQLLGFNCNPQADSQFLPLTYRQVLAGQEAQPLAPLLNLRASDFRSNDFADQICSHRTNRGRNCSFGSLLN